MEACALVSTLHGRLLRGLAVESGLHFQGLRSAAAHLRRSGLVCNRTARRLSGIDTAFAYNRHITAVLADQFAIEIMNEVRANAKKKGVSEVDLFPVRVDPVVGPMAPSGSQQASSVNIPDSIARFEKEIEAVKNDVVAIASTPPVVPAAHSMYVDSYFQTMRDRMPSMLPPKFLDTYNAAADNDKDQFVELFGKLLIDSFEDVGSSSKKEFDISAARKLVAARASDEARKMIKQQQQQQQSPVARSSG